MTFFLSCSPDTNGDPTVTVGVNEEVFFDLPWTEARRLGRLLLAHTDEPPPPSSNQIGYR